MKRIFTLITILLALVSCNKKETEGPQPVASVSSVEGGVFITGSDKLTKNAMEAQPLFVRDTIETKNGKVKITFADESTFALSENSKIILTEFFVDEHANFRKSTIDMAKGQVRSVVSKHFTGAGSEVNIQTPTVVAGIRGTELAVTADPQESSVYVLDGKVEVYKPKEKEKAVMVEKDMFVTSTAGKPLEAPKIIPEDLRKKLFENNDYMPSDFKEKFKAFEDTLQDKKAAMEQKAKETKQKMTDKKKDVEDKMKATQDTFDRKADETKSEMDKKREEMEKKMKEKLKQ